MVSPIAVTTFAGVVDLLNTSIDLSVPAAASDMASASCRTKAHHDETAFDANYCEIK
jgi:hypothetical protein